MAKWNSTWVVRVFRHLLFRHLLKDGGLRCKSLPAWMRKNGGNSDWTIRVARIGEPPSKYWQLELTNVTSPLSISSSFQKLRSRRWNGASASQFLLSIAC